MPLAAHRECNAPRCGAYATRNGYCDGHQGHHRASVASPVPGANLTPANRRFQWMRRAYLLAHPMCAVCHVEPATVLDHVVPHRGMSTLFWSQTNWQGLCVRCHGRKTARELWSA